LVPQPSEVIACSPKGELKLGLAMPAAASVLLPSSHSSTFGIRFTLSLSTAALAALEEFRNGGSLELRANLVAHPLAVYRDSSSAPGIDVRPTATDYSFAVPKEHWLAVLRDLGFCQSVVLELSLPVAGPSTMTEGRARLMQAVNARNDGSYAETMRRCRIALDELKKVGFGGKAPTDIAKFLQEKAGSLTQGERFSALQLALQLFLAPAHHANAPEEYYTRDDAELAIAMTAAILRLAPQHAHDGSDSQDTLAR
jgi:hypothetical protein